MIAASRRHCLFALLTTAAGVSLATAAAATISDLTAFLQRAEKMARFHRPVRADVKIRRQDGSGDEAVVIVDPESGKAFVALRSAGYRALVPLEWGPGTAIEKSGSSPAPQGADDLLGTSGLRAVDFFSPWAADYSTAFISDESPHEKTVTVYAARTVPYSLFVITFDKERLVPTVTKYYRDQLNNLVRLRHDADHVVVGARPRPRKVTITDYVDNSTHTFEIAWSELQAVPPALFDAGSFASAELSWPDAGASAD